MEKLVITGGCGFIGINLIRYLRKKHPRLKFRIIDNLSVGSIENLAAACHFRQIEDGYKEWGNPVQLVVGDILDPELAERVCAGADGVVHLAANTGVIPSIENPRQDCQINVSGTFNYLHACKENAVRRFILASSGAALGNHTPPIHENLVARPISPYGASKLCGEAYCSVFFNTYQVETVCLRFGNVYGPHSTHKESVIAKFLGQILRDEPLTLYGDGAQTRDFIFTEDLCNAIYAALTTPGVGGEVFQIATHKERTISEVAERLNELSREMFGRSSSIQFAERRTGEVQRNFSDIRKAKSRLNWSPEISFEEGLKKTVQWYQEKLPHGQK